MKFSVPLFIGLRYTRSKRSEGFFSFVSGFSFLAMALGVAALIIVMAVMNGFDREIKIRLLNIIPHLTLTSEQDNLNWESVAERLRLVHGIEMVYPFIEGQGMLSGGNSLQGVIIQGIDPGRSHITATLNENMLGGSPELLQAGEYGVVLGRLLARSLNVVTGDSLVLSLPELTVTPVGVFPRVKRVRVVGIFQVGAQVDDGIAFMHIQDIGKLLRLGHHIQGLRLSVADPFRLRTVVGELEKILPGSVKILSWQQSMQALFSAIRMEKTVVGLLLTVIIGVAAFNIVASLVLMVADKRKDMAVLRTIGATSATVTAIFRVQGAAVGLSGVVLGLLVGCLAGYWIGDIVTFLEAVFGFQIFDPSVYFISTLPSELQVADIVIVGTVAAVLSLLATLYPSYRAGQIQPAEVLRYDH